MLIMQTLGYMTFYLAQKDSGAHTVLWGRPYGQSPKLAVYTGAIGC